MPLVRFLGFPTGSSVSLAAGQGSETADITVARWNVARTSEDIALALTRARPEFRRAPEAIWAEAMPTGFSGLTRRMQVPAPTGTADWSNGPGTYPGFTTTAAPETDAPVTIRIAGVGASPPASTVLFEAGGDGTGIAAALDSEGDLVVGVGDGAATEGDDGAAFVRIKHRWLRDQDVDIWISVDPETGRLRVCVVDAATKKLLTAATAPGNPLDVIDAQTDLSPLFANGEDGFWLDVSDLSTLSQNIDGTGAVTAVGDPVGRIADKSGNGRDWVARDDGTGGTDTRPTLQQDANGKYYLDFNRPEGDIGSFPGGMATCTATGAMFAVMTEYTGGGANAEFGASYPYRVDEGTTTPFEFHRTGSAGLEATVALADGTAISAGANLVDAGALTWKMGVATTLDPTIDGVATFLGDGRSAITSRGGQDFADFVLGGSMWYPGHYNNFGSEYSPQHFYGGVFVARGVTQAERQMVVTWLEKLITPGVAIPTWADGGGVGVGQANGTVRAGVETGTFTGTMGDVSIWGDQLPADFHDDPPVRYEPEFHEIFYEWDCVRVSDGRRLDYSAPQNVPQEFKDAGRQRGRYACFVVHEPGDWEITCTARQIKSVDPLTFVEVSRSTQVTVGPSLFGPTAGDPIFTADNTICMAADGDFTGSPAGHHIPYEPAGPGNAYRTALAAARNSAPTMDDGTRVVRVLLKRGEGQAAPISGEWYNGYELHSRDWTNPADHIIYGTWGDGPNPVTDGIEDAGFGNQSSRPETILWAGIDIKGSLDHVLRDYTGTDGDKDTFRLSIAPGSLRVVTRCSVIDKWSIGVYPTLSGDDNALHAQNNSMVVVHDCVFDHCMDYAMLGTYGPRGHRTAFIGNRAVHPPDAPVYLIDEGPGLARKNHGGIRLNGVGDLIVDGNDFFHRHGWTGDTPWPDGTPRVAAQNHARIGGSALEDSGRIVFTRNAGEGDSAMFSFSLLGGNPCSLQNALVDGNYKLAGAGGALFGYAEGGAVTFRNNMLVHRLVPGGMTVPYMMTYENNARLSTTIEQIAWEPVAHYNNTLVLLDYDGASPIQDDVIVSDDLEVYTVANNVIHAPALAGQAGHVDLAPLDSAELFDARYLGRWEGGYDTALVTSLATPDGTASLYAPLPGSPVEGGATAGYVSLFDIVGKQRWPLATLGAVQVPSS